MDDLAFLFEKHLETTVFISDEQRKDTTSRRLYGKYFPDTAIYNVFPPGLASHGEPICDVLPAGSAPATLGLCATATDDGLAFYQNGKAVKVESYGLYQSIFSRNTGILETGRMADKRVVILGCGSVGSLVATELAKAGVGSFLLCDADILEYHNLCRHQCGIEDVGDLKVNALERKLTSINPYVNVEKFEGIIQNIPKTQLDSFCVPGSTLFIGCADNRDADVYANRISIYYSACFLSIGFWERAFAGEIFYHIPKREMPCYECALGNGGNVSARAQANHHIYSNQENTEGLKFEPGISVDIDFITTIGIKMAIDLLCSGDADYIPRLINDLSQYTLVCNTDNPDIGGEMVEIFSYPLQITTSLVVGYGKRACRESGVCKYEKQEADAQ